MVRINLLPDLRQAKLKELNRRRLAVSVGVGICGFVVAVLVIMLILVEAENLQISNSKKQITARQAQLENLGPPLITALTAQQTLNTLPSLYTQRVYYTDLFSELSGLLPPNVFVSSIQDSGKGSITISGTAPSYTAVAQLTKALAASASATGAQLVGGSSPFSSVTIGSLAKGGSGGGVNYSLVAIVNSKVLSNGK